MPSRSRRLIRLRCGALPSFPGTMRPTRSAKGERGASLPCDGAHAAELPFVVLAAAAAPGTRPNGSSARAAHRLAASLPLPCWTQFRSRPSGGELLAAVRAPRRDDPAAADRAHASPKTMPALADELARLIGAFHGTNSKDDGREFENRGSRDRLSRSGGLSERKIAALTERRAYARGIGESQRFGPCVRFQRFGLDLTRDLPPSMLIGMKEGAWRTFEKRRRSIPIVASAIIYFPFAIRGRAEPPCPTRSPSPSSPAISAPARPPCSTASSPRSTGGNSRSSSMSSARSASTTSSWSAPTRKSSR